MNTNYTSLSLDPLLALAESKVTEGSTLTDLAFADMVGVDKRTIARWRAAGNELSWRAADSAAINMGEHPIRIWGDDWLALDADVINDDLPRKKANAIRRAMERIGEVLAEEAARSNELAA